MSSLPNGQRGHFYCVKTGHFYCSSTGWSHARSNTSSPPDRCKNGVPQRRCLASAFDPATPAKRAWVGAAANGCLPKQIGGNVEMGHLGFFHRFQTFPRFPPLTPISTEYHHFHRFSPFATITTISP